MQICIILSTCRFVNLGVWLNVWLTNMLGVMLSLEHVPKPKHKSLYVDVI